MDEPALSVVTATRQRPALLRSKARSLARQTLPPERFEWLVGFDGAPDEAARRVVEAPAPFAIRCAILRAPRGAGAARNAAAALARGDTLVFSDDDCLLDEDVLERHLAAQATPCMAIGPIRFVDPDSGRALGTRAFRAPRWWHLHGANASVPAEAFHRVGGFDPALRGYGGEDLLLGWRLHRLGLPARALNHGAVAHQGPDPTRAADPDKARSAGRNAAAIAAREPELAWRLGVHPLLLGAKALLLETRLQRPLARLAPAWTRYERAYASGARAHRDALDRGNGASPNAGGRAIENDGPTGPEEDA